MSANAENSSIGIVAGGGQFPLLFAKAAQKAGRRVVVVAHKGETDEAVASVADSICWIKLGQFGKLISYFKSNGVRETVFLGSIEKPRMFRSVFPDLKALALWKKIDRKQDDAILRAVAAALEEEGIVVRESTLYLQDLLFPFGVLTKNKPSRTQHRDIVFGWKIAREIGALDIGQCVVVRDCTVLAVEAIEGTDAAILRGGQLAGEKCVVVKVKKPGQDFRFDLPAIGIDTIRNLARVNGAVLAAEAGQSLLFDREQVVAEAEKAGITIVGVSENADTTLSL
ncbi:MAG: hypothetical protein CSB23_03130 [Deltaproteobacteria bacterium]|nr:MAG: hypothetical protein CSB23_03130 [Deltaproteobacteria bacterium]